MVARATLAQQHIVLAVHLVCIGVAAMAPAAVLALVAPDCPNTEVGVATAA